MSFYVNNQEPKEIFYNKKEVKAMYYNNKLVWQTDVSPEEIEENKKYAVKFTSGTSSTFSLTARGVGKGIYVSYPQAQLEYSVDGAIWNTLENDQETESSKEIYVRGSGGVSVGRRITVNNSVKCKISGNILNLLDYVKVKNNETITLGDYTFYNLFYYPKNIEDCGDLIMPSGVLPKYACYGMFEGHESTSSLRGLVIPPDLPATEVGEHCYERMFIYSNITTLPALPATTLGEYCYYYMFYDTPAGNTYIPALPAKKLPKHCYEYILSSTYLHKTKDSTWCNTYRIPTSGSGSYINGTQQDATYYHDFAISDDSYATAKLNTTYYTNKIVVSV